MIMELYSIKDEYTGFAPPVTFANKQIAKRWFKEMKTENITVKTSPEDFSLYYMGTFDSDNGKMVPPENFYPELVERA